MSDHQTTGDTHTIRITIRVTADLRDRITAAASAEGMPAAVWLRALAIRELENRRDRRDGRGGVR